MCISLFWENNENVGKLIKDEPVQHVTENIINQCLKNCGDIDEATRHHQVDKMPKESVESSFSLNLLTESEAI